jgi:hypothetical protein
MFAPSDHLGVRRGIIEPSPRSTRCDSRRSAGSGSKNPVSPDRWRSAPSIARHACLSGRRWEHGDEPWPRPQHSHRQQGLLGDRPRYLMKRSTRVWTISNAAAPRGPGYSASVGIRRPPLARGRSTSRMIWKLSRTGIASVSTMNDTSVPSAGGAGGRRGAGRTVVKLSGISSARCSNLELKERSWRRRRTSLAPAIPGNRETQMRVRRRRLSNKIGDCLGHLTDSVQLRRIQ